MTYRRAIEIDGPASPHVLIVDDDDGVRSHIAGRLRAQGMVLDEAVSAEDALRLLDDGHDLLIVDVDLPGIDGFDLVREVRRTRSVPILMLTASGEESDRVLGFELGADDYVVKPFLPRELTARVQALLRRAGRTEASTTGRRFSFGDVEVDLDAVDVSRRGNAVTLTHKEFELLSYMLRSPRRAHTREVLLREVWGSDVEWQKPATVTEHVHRLRRLLERDPANPIHIKTVRGLGYRFDP